MVYEKDCFVSFGESPSVGDDDDDCFADFGESSDFDPVEDIVDSSFEEKYDKIFDIRPIRKTVRPEGLNDKVLDPFKIDRSFLE